jgi:hypothetical protein
MVGRPNVEINSLIGWYKEEVIVDSVSTILVIYAKTHDLVFDSFSFVFLTVYFVEKISSQTRQCLSNLKSVIELVLISDFFLAKWKGNPTLKKKESVAAREER